MQEWKENVMQEVARELHVIRQMHEGAMEAQRQSFQLEFEHVGGKVEQARVGIESHAVTEAPTGLARALLYIVRGSPSFLHQLFKSFYYTNLKSTSVK